MSEDGQASVELVGIVPALLAALLIVWQLALAGHTLWLAASASRVASRAELVGGDAQAAARSAIPQGLEGGLEVDSSEDGVTRVRVPVPLVYPGWAGPLKVSATTSLEARQ